jgi:hypothetical protein
MANYNPIRPVELLDRWPGALRAILEHAEPEDVFGEFFVDELGFLYSRISDYGGTCTTRWTGTDWEELGLEEEDDA